VVERVVDGHVPVQLHGQPVSWAEIGIADLVLRAATVGKAQFQRPPLTRSSAGRLWDKQADRTGTRGAAPLLTVPLGLRLEARRERDERLLGQELRQFGTEAINFRFEAVAVAVGLWSSAALVEDSCFLRARGRAEHMYNILQLSRIDSLPNFRTRRSAANSRPALRIGVFLLQAVPMAPTDGEAHIMRWKAGTSCPGGYQMNESEH
jgi:hypothetical protein